MAQRVQFKGCGVIGGIRKRRPADTVAPLAAPGCRRPLPKVPSGQRNGVTGDDRVGRPVRRCRLGQIDRWHHGCTA